MLLQQKPLPASVACTMGHGSTLCCAWQKHAMRLLPKRSAVDSAPTRTPSWLRVSAAGLLRDSSPGCTSSSMPCKAWVGCQRDQVVHRVRGSLRRAAHQLTQHRLHVFIMAGLRLLERLMRQRWVVPLRDATHVSGRHVGSRPCPGRAVCAYLCTLEHGWHLGRAPGGTRLAPRSRFYPSFTASIAGVLHP
jgi:hypothetical protein